MNDEMNKTQKTIISDMDIINNVKTVLYKDFENANTPAERRAIADSLKSIIKLKVVNIEENTDSLEESLRKILSDKSIVESSNVDKFTEVNE